MVFPRVNILSHTVMIEILPSGSVSFATSLKEYQLKRKSVRLTENIFKMSTENIETLKYHDQLNKSVGNSLYECSFVITTCQIKMSRKSKRIYIWSSRIDAFSTFVKWTKMTFLLLTFFTVMSFLLKDSVACYSSGQKSIIQVNSDLKHLL